PSTLIPAASSALRAAIPSWTQTWMMPRPSMPRPHRPSMLIPAAPSASPMVASPPGLSSVVIVRSVAMDPPLGLRYMVHTPDPSNGQIGSPDRDVWAGVSPEIAGGYGPPTPDPAARHVPAAPSVARLPLRRREEVRRRRGGEPGGPRRLLRILL